MSDEAGPVVTSVTESANPATASIDTLPTLDMLRLINAEDARVAPAVAEGLPNIAAAVDAIAERMRHGGRLIYAGAGTSGYLGLLDASEMPPTFNTPPDLVIALVAGGGPGAASMADSAGVEDDAVQGAADLARLDVGAGDSVVGITASGGTAYVMGVLGEARRCGALTISIACNRPAPVQALSDIAISLPVGPEVLTGSTRLKAGTAQKMALNMLSTGVMIRLGKTFGNLMVDVQPGNAKLQMRAQRIVQQACHLSPDDAARVLQQCDGETRTAIVAELARVTPAEARHRLRAAGGVIRAALKSR